MSSMTNPYTYSRFISKDNKTKAFIITFYLFTSAVIIDNCYGASKNYTALNESIDDVLTRQKRFLVFPPTTAVSVLKFVTGYLGPIDIPSWQNINCLRNLQYQYNLPFNWVSKFPTFPGLWTRRSENGRAFSEKKSEVKIKADSSRKIAYEILEDILNKENKNGRECILLTICQVAEAPLSHNGLVGELLQTFFTPGEHEIFDDDYRYAMKAGLHHVDCDKLYPDCPFDHRILDSFSIVQNFHLDNVLNF